MKKGKERKDIKIVAAWIENNKVLRCRGMVDDVEVAFKAAEVGHPDPNGNVMTLDGMKELLNSLQDKMRRNKN